MATKKNDEVPPVPVPTSASNSSAVPPIEPAPAAKTAPKTAPNAAPKAAPAAAAQAPAPQATVAPPAPPAPPAPAAIVPPVAPAATPPAATGYGTPGYTYSPPPAGPPQGLSITSMVLGIAGLFFGLLVSIAAVITGHMAQRSQPHAKPFWITGIITGYIGIALGVIATIILIIWIVFFFSIAQNASFGGY